MPPDSFEHPCINSVAWRIDVISIGVLHCLLIYMVFPRQILGRYFMGYWPSKLACILNLIMQIGWGIIGCIIAGQMFSAINGGGLTIAVGCIVASLLIGLIATFGIGIVHTIERCAVHTRWDSEIDWLTPKQICFHPTNVRHHRPLR